MSITQTTQQNGNTKEESEQIVKLLSKLGIQEPVGIETLTNLTKVLPRVKKKKEIKKERLSIGADNIDSDEEDEKGKGKATVLPKLTWFCGQTAIPKGHVSFEALKHEVGGLMKLHDTQIVIQLIRHSLR